MSNIVAEAGINTGPLANPFGAPNPVPAGQFGEAAVDLTASNLIPCCEPQAYGASTKLEGVGLTPGAGTYVDEAHFTS